MKALIIILSIFFYTSVNSQNSSPNCDTISESVLFNSGDYSINKNATSSLKRIIENLNQNEVTTIELIGHTDPHGSIEYNRNLSKQRVENVQAYILDYLDLETKTDYFGETKLLLTDTTKVSDSLNRRVEIKYYINCSASNNISTSDNIIYYPDPNCHIDTALTQSQYSATLIGDSKSSVVVMDWTRSMYFYGLELLKWFENNEDKASFNDLVIFNDGDGKPTSKKPMGSTRGIYSTSIDSKETVIKLMESVAKKGTGGDFPENYIEALIVAQNKFPEVDTLVLIADNRACIRDYKLMAQLNKPVVIILNEINEEERIVNYQYVNLVAHAGGRIVFMNHSIENIKFKNDQGFKPIYFKDTVIVLPKVKGNLDYALEQIARMKADKIKVSIPPILMVESKELPICFNKLIPTTDVKIGCANCKKYDYTTKTHTIFEVKYTLRQRIAMRWRNRPRARFGVTSYKCKKIKCSECKNIDSRDERKKCLREKNRCKKEKKTCERNKSKAKRNLKKYRKKKRKSFWTLSKKKKSKSSSKTTKTPQEQ